MKKHIATKIIMIFILLAIACPLLSQTYRAFRREVQDIVENKTRFKVGPFRLYPQIRLRDVGYDGNVYRWQDDNNPISDYTATLSPVLQVHTLFSNWLILSLEENPEYIHYFKVTRERAFNNSIVPGIKMLLFKRFVLSGQYSYQNRRRRASSEFDVRTNELTKRYTGRFFYETARRTMIGFSGSIRKTSYEDITLPGEEIYRFRYLNREERSGSMEFYYRLFSRSTFFITAGYTEYKFDDIDAQWHNSHSYQVSTGLRFPLIGRMRGAVSVGYKQLVPKTKELKGFSGFVGSSSLNLRTGRFALRLGYSRNSQFSFWTSNIYFLEDRYSPGISFYLARFLKIDYNFSYGENRYQEPDILRFPDGRVEEVKRIDIHKSHSVGFAVRVVGRMGIGISLTFWKVTSNFYFRGNREQLFVGFYLTQDF
jgi:hypothetical protein